MLLGIDVGGTFTDAVAIVGGKIVAKTKQPTTHEDLLQGVFAAIDTILADCPEMIERVSLSTTVVTNSLIEGKGDKVGLIIIPGPGLDIEPLLPGKALVLSGYTDHRGKVTAPLLQQEITALFDGLLSDKKVIAISGKFAVRNSSQEIAIAREIMNRQGVLHVTQAHMLSGSLNFLRRTNAAYFNGAVWRTFQQFATAVEGALAARQIDGPVHILKADGGTMPMVLAKERPVEAIFTGPAASVLGIMALHSTQGDTVSLDIGGTSTDIALWRNGEPLFADRGALIGVYPTAVQAFWLQSVGVGGDSVVRRQDGKIVVGPERKGPAMAVGGSQPALADALIVARRAQFGNMALAYEAMGHLALPGQTPEEVAQEVWQVAIDIIQQAIESMVVDYRTQPVYTVHDMIHDRPFAPTILVGVGGTAAALAPLVADRMGLDCVVPPGADVANALGAALARATTDITVRADTEQGFYTVAEMGIKEKLSNRRITIGDVRQLADHHLVNRAKQCGIAVEAIETVYEEEFHLVRGFSTAGEIITCRKQIKPGVMKYV